MKQLQLINDDWLGHAEHLRHACRGIVVKDGKVLLSYEEKQDQYLIPGGGVEEGETLEECCIREVLEETGIAVKPVDYYLEIEELFCDWRHINHYFVCEVVEDTGKPHLTEGEAQVGCTHVWLPFAEIVEIFGRFEEYRATDVPRYGLYKREGVAIREYLALNGAKE